MDSAAEQLSGIAATHHRFFFFLPENLKGLGLQTNASAMVVYLGLVYIYFRVEKGDPPGALKVA